MSDAAQATKSQKPVRACIDVGATRKPPYKVAACSGGHVHLELMHPGNKLITDVLFPTPEAAYEFAQQVLQAYDRLLGI